jgi:hypothetical protein
LSLAPATISGWSGRSARHPPECAVGGELWALVVEGDVSDDRVVEVLDAADVEADVV